MRPTTLFTNKRYFGLDPVKLKTGARQVIGRPGKPPATEDVTIGRTTLIRSFGVNPVDVRAFASELVQNGLLELNDADGGDRQYRTTEQFRRIATAEIMHPLPRRGAELAVSSVRDLATAFNRNALHNRHEIYEIAVYGEFMSREAEIARLAFAVTGRRRPPPPRGLLRRAPEQTQGHQAIRSMIENLSPYVHVDFFQRLSEVPRPFSVIFKADD